MAHLLRNHASDSLAELAILLQRTIEQLSISRNGGAVLLLFLLCLSSLATNRGLRLSSLRQGRGSRYVPDNLLRLLSEGDILQT